MRKYKLIAIAAVADNGVIGNGDSLPWHIPEDLKWFKSATLGKVIVMGRGTYKSIGRPLPGRTTYVLTRNPSSVSEIPDIDSIPGNPDQVFLCGGAEIYARYLFECDELLVTRVFGEFAGDKYMPYFSHKFELAEVIAENERFKIERHLRKDET